MDPILFYDGRCGLCHRAVQLLLRLDRHARLRYAPLGGTTFRERVAEDERRRLPDSLVLQAGGRLLSRSVAVRESLLLLGGPARLMGTALRIVPGTLADSFYDAIAHRRSRLFAPPDDSCPVLPGRWRERFLP
jgi:predicted DCC family thiol-disulfide oxidoreductase YuxK